MQLNLLVLRTSNIEKLSKFYEHLGLVFQYHRHGKGPYHFSAEVAGIVFEIYPLLKSQMAPDPSLRLGFNVPQLDVLLDKLKKKGVDIIKEPTHSEWGYVAIIKDLDGRKIELKEVG